MYENYCLPMMKRPILILLPLLTLLCTGNVSAQFSMSKVAKPKDRPSTIADSIKQTRLENDYFSLARYKADRRALIKERNTIEFKASLHASQTQYENWSAGGDNTFASRAEMSFAHKFKKGGYTLDYKLSARYGFNIIPVETDGSKDAKLFKNEDEWVVKVQNLYIMHKNWSYSALVNVRSQFTTGYKSRTDKTKKTNFFAPGYIDLSLGLDYKHPKQPLNVTLSPISGSAIVVMDESLARTGLGGVPADRFDDAGNLILRHKHSKWELGSSVQVKYDKTFGKRDTFRYQTNLFSFCGWSNVPTVRWENTFDIKATKLLSTTFYIQLYYDKEDILAGDTRAKLQAKYSLSVGLSYTFKNK